MLKILQTAIAAREQKDWSLVSHCLHQLPLDDSHSFNEEEWETVLKLALQVLQETDFQQRWDIAKVLPKLGKDAIAPLIVLLEDEATDIEVRWFVCRILSQFDDPRCAIALIKLMAATEDEELALMASQSLTNLGTDAIVALSCAMEDEGVRSLAVQALAQMRHPDAIAPLLQGVDDPNPQIRATAIEALGSFPNQEILPILLKALQDSASNVRKEAVIALGRRSRHCLDLNLVGSIQPLLYDFNLTVCQQAAIALGKLGTNPAADALFPLLQSPVTPKELKLTIVQALSWMETETAFKYLHQTLKGSDRDICREIITLLGRTNAPELKNIATDILLRFFSASGKILENTEIKQTLAMSLGELGNESAIEPLTQLSADPDQSVSLHAIAALRKVVP